MPSETLKKPIFLMCSERSGSNLITKIFDAHPEFTGPGTSHLFRIFAELACRYTGHESALRADVLKMFDAKVGAWQIDSVPPQERQQLVQGYKDAAMMIAALMNAERERAGKVRLFIKENSIYRFIPFLESVSDNPAYLFMVRDPRDMALSWHKSAILRGGVVRASKRWVTDQQGFLAAVSWLRNMRPISFLTYEQLLDAPERELKRVCADLGVAFSSKMLDFNTHSLSAQADAERAQVWDNLTRPLMSDNFNKFEAALSDEQLAYIEALCGPLMGAFGYCKVRPANSPPFASHDSFENLKAALETAEPWTKADYPAIPEEQRARFEQWSDIYSQLQRRPFSPLCFTHSDKTSER